ncbi:hypothetical protein [Streptomyces sp. MMBL 11-3]
MPTTYAARGAEPGTRHRRPRPYRDAAPHPVLAPLIPKETVSWDSI